MRMTRSYIFLCALGLSSGCARTPPEGNELEEALESIAPEEIRAHMSFLADDLLEGRDTGTRGYALAARYVASQLESMGLAPAGDDGTYSQAVPLRRASLEENGSRLAIVEEGGRTLELTSGEDYLLFPSFEAGEREARAQLVFAGYGISAPELGWDDFAGIDVSGKILVAISGAPPSFGSTERAFYSSRDNKAEAALKKGAVGMLLFQHPADDARRPWSRMREFYSGSAMTWVDPSTGKPQSAANELTVSGMLSPSAAQSLFAGARVPLEQIFEQSVSDAGPPRFELDRSAVIRTRSLVEDIESENVVARLEGAGPRAARGARDLAAQRPSGAPPHFFGQPRDAATPRRRSTRHARGVPRDARVPPGGGRQRHPLANVGPAAHAGRARVRGRGERGALDLPGHEGGSGGRGRDAGRDRRLARRDRGKGRPTLRLRR